MATFVDKSFEELMEGAPKVIREGLTGTRTYVFPLPDNPNKGVIVELNGQDRIIGSWTITKGNAYRITPQRVVRMPLIDNDPSPVRRFCRMNGIALTRIVYCTRGQRIYFGRFYHQGDDDHRSIEDGEPSVAIKGVQTVGNPAYVWKVMVVSGEEPETWDKFVEVAKGWREIQDGTFHL